MVDGYNSDGKWNNLQDYSEGSNINLSIDLPDNPEVLQLCIEELNNAIFHLERSNKEIENFDRDQSDSELQLAIVENIEAIRIKQQRKEILTKKLKTLAPSAVDRSLISADTKDSPNACLTSIELDQQNRRDVVTGDGILSTDEDLLSSVTVTSSTSETRASASAGSRILL